MSGDDVVTGAIPPRRRTQLGGVTRPIGGVAHSCCRLLSRQWDGTGLRHPTLCAKSPGDVLVVEGVCSRLVEADEAVAEGSEGGVVGVFAARWVS
jgi:hypothetical protein